MASNGLLNFHGTNKATFVGENSNIVFDTVNSSLGIGITGTDSPTSNLYITGNAYVTSDISVGGVLNMGIVDVSARYGLEAVTAVDASTPETITLTNTGTSLVASGNVGIGTTTSPGYLLDVQSTSDAADKNITRLYSAANASGVSSTGLRVEKGTGYGGIVKGFISQGVGSGLSLHTLNSGTDVQAMTIMNSGNIGIGASSPGYKLDVYGTANVGVLTATTLTTSGGATFNTNTLKVDAVNSRVGVGTSSPGFKLHVKDLTDYSVIGRFESRATSLVGTSSSAYVDVVDGTGHGGYIQGIHDPWVTHGLRLGTLTSGTRDSIAMTILNHGAIGIGTTTPDRKLHVETPTGTSENYIKIGSRMNNGSAQSISGIEFQTNPQFYNGDNGVRIPARITSGFLNGPAGTANWGDAYLSLLSTTSVSSAALTEHVTCRGGKVGIFTTSPSTALDVNGIIKQTGANWALTNTGVSESLQYRGAAPGDYAYLNRTLSTPTNVTLTHENQGGYNTRSRITIGTTGKYAMYVNGFRQTGTSGTKELFIYKNGVYVYVRAYSGPEGTSNYATAGGAYTIMDLNANDYVEVYIGQGTYHGNDSIYFAGHLIA